MIDRLRGRWGARGYVATEGYTCNHQEYIPLTHFSEVPTQTLQAPLSQIDHAGLGLGLGHDVMHESGNLGLLRMGLRIDGTVQYITMRHIGQDRVQLLKVVDLEA